MRRSRFPRSQRERGAAAVEFALVVPLLLAVMFGIVDYGLWFGDSLSVRQGVDEAARRAVVLDFGTCAHPTKSDTEKTACLVDEAVGSLAGTVYVKVTVTGPGGAHKAGEWSKGGDLHVCAMVKVDGLTGLTPMPNDGLLKAEVHKRIEVKGKASVPAYADSGLPSGADWTWCS